MQKITGVPSGTPVLIGTIDSMETNTIKSENLSYENSIQKKSGFRYFLKVFLFIIAILAFFLIYELYIWAPKNISNKEIEIAPGMKLRTIAFLLEEKEIIKSRWIFLGYTLLNGDASRIQVGTYIFPPSSLAEVEQKLISGGETKTLVIPEGWSLRDIESSLRKGNITSPEKFNIAANYPDIQNFKEKFLFLDSLPPNASLEGFLFPDTYKVLNNVTAKDLITLMLENFSAKFSSDLRIEVKKQRKTVYQVITMASLIEKEVASENDRALVSGILWKRLSLEIPLQVDATINYIKKERGTSTPNGKISILDTKIESSYNTYKYAGLPKGPINNPGLSAIKAVIYPKGSPYLYYLSTPDGKTIFSKTLEEHNAAKAKYLN